MKKIQMVDLQTQYQHIKEDIDRGIQAVIDSAAFIKGPAVKSFQEHLEAYTGAKHVIPVGNGTDALQIALMALGLKPGDEVITPTFTFIATVHRRERLVGLHQVGLCADRTERGEVEARVLHGDVLRGDQAGSRLGVLVGEDLELLSEHVAARLAREVPVGVVREPHH